MKQAELGVNWQFYIACPYCDESMDLSDEPFNNDGYFVKLIFNNKWDELVGEEIECTKCEDIFTISSVEPY